MENTEGKVKRLVVAGTAAGVLLITFLLIVIIIQLVQVGVKQAEKDRIAKEIERLEQKIESGEQDYEYFSSFQGLESLAFQNGYTWSNAK